MRDKALKSFGGAGVFVKELEMALLEKRIDIAVHSLKDVPTQQPRGLTIAAIVGREDPRDCAIIKGARTLAALPAGSVVGSGSERRRAQLVSPVSAFNVRGNSCGNVETRIQKVMNGDYAATILARAGLNRLGLLKKAAQTLSLESVLPAPGQGALGIESRTSDRRTRTFLKINSTIRRLRCASPRSALCWRCLVAAATCRSARWEPCAAGNYSSAHSSGLPTDRKQSPRTPPLRSQSHRH